MLSSNETLINRTPAYASYQGCLYQNCIDQLVPVVAIVKDKSIPSILPLKDRLAMCFYLRGCAYAALKNSKEAAANFQNLFQLQESVEIERWVIPFGFVETAELFVKKKNVSFKWLTAHSGAELPKL